MEVRIDLHCHTRHSRDGIGTIEAIARAAQAKGLAGVVITDHDTLRAHDEIRAWNATHANDRFCLYPGIEVTTSRGHLLAIGARETIPLRLEPAECADRIRAAGGVPLPAHPLRPRIGIGAAALDDVASLVPAVEAWNAQEPLRRNAAVARWAERNGHNATGGSDAHQVHDVGNGFTYLPDPGGEVDALLDALEGGKTRGGGRRTPWWTRSRQNLRIARRIVSRRYRAR